MQYREQVEKLDCGIFVVQTMYKYFYDRWLSLPSIKSKANYDKDGISILELSNLMKNFGIKSEPLKGDFDSFKKLKIKEPIISIIKNNNFYHYIIIEKITSKGNVIYYDPLYGKRKIFIDDLKDIFANIIIICKIDKKYRKEEFKQVDLLSYPFFKEKIILCIVSIVLVFLSLISSYYMKVILDQIVPSNDFEKMIIISFLFFLILFIKIILTGTIEWINNRIDLKYRIVFTKKYIRKISDVKFEKISHFDESMHLKNLEMITKISIFKSKFLLSSLSNLFCLISSTAILLAFDVQLFLISFITGCLLTGITFSFKEKFRAIELNSINSDFIFRKCYFDIIKGIKQYKIGSLKAYLNLELDKSIENVIKNQIDYSNVCSIYFLLQSLIKSITPFVIIFLSVNRIWKENLSIGQIFLFLSLFNFFINPFSSLTLLFIEVPIIKQYIDNINSFLLLDNEENDENRIKINEIKSIKIKNINFCFNNSLENMKIRDLIIDSKTKLIGKNGSGKTTLMKIMATLIDVEDIYYNEKNINLYYLSSIREEVCYIGNSEYLPSGTIYNYLISSNKNNPKILLENLEKYNLLELFNQMNLSLSKNIENGGENLSSGQKQFISLMRLFSFDPSLVLLDESFENIDEKILSNVIPKLKKYLSKKLVVEVSHNNNYIFDGKEINCELFK